MAWECDAIEAWAWAAQSTHRFLFDRIEVAAEEEEFTGTH